MSRQMDIVRALLCTCSPGTDCIGKQCPYLTEEKLTPEEARQYGVDKLESCNVDQIGLDAAWELLRLMEKRTK